MLFYDRRLWCKRLIASMVAVLIMALTTEGVSAQTVIYGSMIDNNSWGTWDRYEGIYSFQPVADTGFTPVYTDGWDLAADAGGVLVDGIYHLFNRRQGSTSSWFSVNYTSYYISDWSIENSLYFSDVIMSNDMAYDPVTDRVYCAQKSGTQGKLAVWSPSNIDEISDIGTMDVEIIVIAANGGGELYGVGTDGVLYKIDKTNAQLTAVGATGVMPKGYQSAIFDYSTGKLYWAAYTKTNKSSLYEINISTGEATKITDFANNARFCGLYILGTNSSDNAPAAVSDLTVTFAQGHNDGVIQFTMPTKTCGDELLQGELSYKISVDGEEITSGVAEAGEQVTHDINVATGRHEFVVIISNANGESPRAKVVEYVGKGVPGYVNYPTAHLTGQGNEVSITWEAPDYCIPIEAYFDPTEVRYTIERIPDKVVVADNLQECTFIDNIVYEGPLTVYKYKITAKIDDLSLEGLETNGVAVGDPLEPPYEVSMASADLDLFTILDANHDGTSWSKDYYGYGVQCGGRWEGDCDDWLILPPLHLNSDGVYRVVMEVGNDYDGPSAWELKIGKTPTVDGMSTTLLGKSSTLIGFDDDISVPEEGTYYLGIHCVGHSGTTMYVGDITVRNQTNNNAPDAPTNVSAEGGEKGELSAFIHFTTPTTNIGGDALESLTAVNIYHGDKLVYTLSEVVPGHAYTCKVEANQEFNDYFVAAVNEYGEGRRVKIEDVFAGLDFPGKVTNFVMTDAETGRPKLTWDPATETGLYGYYVDPEEVRYEIYRRYGDDRYDLVVEDYDGLEYIDTDLNADCDQFILTYYIYPVNSIGRSSLTISNSECFGRPYEAPVSERFPDGLTEISPWYYRTDEPGVAGWSIYKNSDTTIEDFDGSNGLMAFYASEPEVEATLYAPYVTVKGLDNPILDFYYYMSDQTIEPTVKVNGDYLYNEAEESVWDNGWYHFASTLIDYKDAELLKIEFAGNADDYMQYAFIDNIRVRNQYQHDLALVTLDVPAEMELGEPAFVTAKVSNDGKVASGAAKITLYRNGYVVAEKELDPLASGHQATVDFVEYTDVTFGEAPTYVAEISYSADEDETNNISEEISSSMKMPRYPAPEGLEAETTEGCVTLTWTAPTATSMSPEPIVEDFEGYEAFAIEMEPWTLIDRDGQATAVMADPEMWVEDLQYPHSGEACAYQVFDPSAAGIDVNLWDSYSPHSGRKAAVCWPSADWNVANDDWLISPELYPMQQTISFHVYTRQGYFGSEKYEVLYSTSDKNPDNFILLAAGSATNKWEKVTVELPEEAKYFAIHTVSYQTSTEIWYDDITYLPASIMSIPLELMGYNVYRDNVRINKQMVETPVYEDTDAETGTHKYNVTAVYGVGESGLSESLMVDAISGVPVVTAKQSVKVIGDVGQIVVIGAEGMSLAIYNVNGIALKRGKSHGYEHSEKLSPGVYIVKVDGDVFKVMVR